MLFLFDMLFQIAHCKGVKKFIKKNSLEQFITTAKKIGCPMNKYKVLQLELSNKWVISWCFLPGGVEVENIKENLHYYCQTI